MLVFAGTYEHTIDAKNRLAVPAEIRAQIHHQPGAPPYGDPVFLYVTLGEDHALCLYTQEVFNALAQGLDASPLPPDELLQYEQLFYSLAARVELDKQGRVRLPEHLLKRTGLGSEVVLIGVKDHLEIRDRAAWQAHVDQVLREQPKLMMNPRRAIRRPPAPEN